jgi:hypothetical protein
MLYLHALVWLTGNLSFNSPQERLLQDRPFASRMICYLEIVIRHSIDLDI